MDLKGVFTVISNMYNKGILKDYAIGGAVATMYYTEPFGTKDVDIFFLAKEGVSLILLTEFYDYLLDNGYKTDAEYIIINNTKIQFVPTAGPLEREALKNAAVVTYEGISVKVFRPEYIIAIALDVFRIQDQLKISKLIDQTKIDEVYLKDILHRYNLEEKFSKFLWENYEQHRG